MFEKLKRFEQSQSKYSEKSLIIQDLAELYYILYAITFEVMLAVYPAYMRKASLTTEDIEMIFFFFVHRDLLLFYCSWQGYLDTMSLH
jgi:hypothetical protein